MVTRRGAKQKTRVSSARVPCIRNDARTMCVSIWHTLGSIHYDDNAHVPSSLVIWSRCLTEDSVRRAESLLDVAAPWFEIVDRFSLMSLRTSGLFWLHVKSWCCTLLHIVAHCCTLLHIVAHCCTWTKDEEALKSVGLWDKSRVSFVIMPLFRTLLSGLHALRKQRVSSGSEPKAWTSHQSILTVGMEHLPNGVRLCVSGSDMHGVHHSQHCIQGHTLA